MKKLDINRLQNVSGGSTIRLVTSDGVYILDLCTGQVKNLIGRVVLTYPGDWMSGNC